MSSSVETVIDESLYSRQIYVVGEQAMKNLAESRVLLSGIGRVGAEIAKNLLLVGVKYLVLQDDKESSWSDLGASMFIKPEHVFLKTNRAEAYLPLIQELNPNAHLSKVTHKILSPEFNCADLLLFDCIILTEADLDTKIQIDSFCYKQNPPIKFISCDVYGVFGTLFCNFGKNFTILDSDDNEPSEILIGNITKDNPAVVSTVQETPHKLETGNRVIFHSVVGMEELNGTSRRVEVLSSSTFSIEMTENCADYIRGGSFKKVKPIVHMDFENLQDQMSNPTLLTPDMAKEEAPLTIHVGMIALDSFRQVRGRLPKPWDREDEYFLLEIADRVGSTLNVGKVNVELLKTLSHTAEGQLFPLVSFFGAVAAQETVKALTGKFTPLKQWLNLDAVEVVPDIMSFRESKLSLDLLSGPNYVCLGDEVIQKLSLLNVFMVGCGALGCEMLKNFAMLGVSTTKGNLTITDDDVIEKSNLSRQFLFRSSDIGSSKSQAARKSVMKMNSLMNIDAYQLRVSEQTEYIFNDEFYDNLNVVVNALDNVETREYMDRCCLKYKLPLLESGTAGCKGHVQVILPYITENYGSQQDPHDDTYPVCTIKTFPTKLEHAAQWAKEEFEEQFTEKPSNFNQFWSDNGNLTEVLQTLSLEQQIEGISAIAKMISRRPYTWEDCVRFARLEFEKHFNHNAQQLLYTFPLGEKLKDGSPFWQSPKLPPTPLQFHLDNELHYKFVAATAKLKANIWNISYSPEDNVLSNIREILSQVDTPSFSPNPDKLIDTDENGSRQESSKQKLSNNECVKILKEALRRMGQNKDLHMTALTFEKDDETAGHMDFIAATTNLRAIMYNIEPSSQSRIKQIAGNIIPAIATTTAAISGLVALELVKVAKDIIDRKDYRNCFLNLALPVFVFSEPAPPLTSQFTSGRNFTVWNNLEVIGRSDMKLVDFMTILRNKVGLRPSMILTGKKIIWMNLMPLYNKKLNCTMLELLSPSTETTFMELSVLYERTGHGADEEDDIIGPTVRYIF